MTPFHRLGIDVDADEATIKRAYARLLKQNRPDEDAHAFQQLRDTYAACLLLARQRAPQALGRNDAEPDEPASFDKGPSVRKAMPPLSSIPDTAAPAISPDSSDHRELKAEGHGDLTDTFDLNQFLSEFSQQLAKDQPDALRRWLENCKPLYSLQLKQTVSGHVIELLASMHLPPKPATLEIPLRFFGLDALSLQHGLGEQVRALEQRSVTAQAFLRETTQAVRSPSRRWADRILLRELMEPDPIKPLRRSFLMLFPQMATRMRALILHLHNLDAVMARTSLNAGSVAFWHLATDPYRFTRPRMVLVTLRLAFHSSWMAALLAWLISPPVAYGIVFAKTFGVLGALWFVGATLKFALLKLRMWNQAHARLDEPWLITIVLGAIAVLFSPWWPIVGGIILTLLSFAWLSPRRDAPALCGALAALGMAATTTLLLAATRTLELWDLKLAIVSVPLSALAMLLAHDEIYSRRHRIPVAQVRRATGWLGYIGLAQVVAITLLIYAL